MPPLRVEDLWPDRKQWQRGDPMHILSLAHIVLAANGDPKANSFYKRTSFRLLDEDSATQLTQLKGNAEAPEFGCRVFLFCEVKQRC